MDWNVVLLFNYKKEQKAFCVGATTRMDQLFEACRAKWNDLSLGHFSLQYALAEVTSCCLDCDMDLIAMLCLAQQYQLKLVQVKVFVKRGDETPANQSEPVQVQQPRDLYQGFVPTVSKEATLNFNGIVANVLNSCERTKPKRKWGKVVIEDDGEMPAYDICPKVRKKYLLSSHWENGIQGVDQEFYGGAIEFRETLIQYSTFHGFKYKYQSNQSDKFVDLFVFRKLSANVNLAGIYVVCENAFKESKCQWFIRANAIRGRKEHLIIKAANLNHSCESSLTSTDTSRFGKVMISQLIDEHVRNTPTFSASEVEMLLKAGYGVNIPYYRCWEALDIARNNIFGSFSESFDQLQWYCLAILKTNPGSHVVIEANKVTKRFERAFIAFKACIDGFKFCRPLLYVDGTFMTARWNGTVLAATAKDGNNGIFPVAITIVQSETLANWQWFLEQLRDNVKHDQEILYMSDRNTSLLSAFPLVFDKPCNFFCLVHLFANLKGQYGPGFSDPYRIKMCSLLKKCAYAPTRRLFDIALAKFNEAGLAKGAAWIAKVDPTKWAVSHAPNIMRYGEMTSNAAESFNNWIRDARSLPVTFMVDCIRTGIMRWFVERRAAASTWGSILTVAYQKRWNDNSYVSKNYGVLQCPDGRYEVRSIPRVEVDMKLKTCTYYHWQVDGFPCAHAVAVMRSTVGNVEGLIDKQFYTAAYKNAYKENLHCVPETEKFEQQAMLDENKILPPEKAIKVGRPQSKRIPSFGEIPKRPLWRCAKCKKLGRHDPIICAITSDDDI